MSSALRARIHDSVASIPAAQWERLRDASWTPFQHHTWMRALEDAQCASPERGWTPRHVALWRGDTLVAVAPAYLRTDSQGEFVFDHGWAGAAERAGIRYFPKLTLAVPFTPCPGRRFLVAPDEPRADRVRDLMREVLVLARAERVSSVHALFVTDDEADAAAAEGASIRHGMGIGEPTRHPRWHGSAPVAGRDSGLAKRLRERVTADDEASGASPKRG